MSFGLAQAAGAATEAGPQRTLGVEPSVSVTQTFSDNYNLSTAAESDAVTRLNAGLTLRGRTGALRGFADYSLTQLVYARHSDRNDLQNALNANLTADLVDDRVQLATNANIYRSAISAFGTQAGSGSDASSNTSEVRTLQIMPSLRGPLGTGLRYTASVGHVVTSASNSSTGNSTSTTADLHIQPVEIARLGWSVDASHTTSGFKGGRDTSSDRLYGALQLQLPDQDLRLSASGGTERTNLASLDARGYTTWGLGLLWTPSPVTRLSAELEHRFYGQSHAVSLEHRTPRTVFRVRSARSLSTTGNQQVGVQGAAYDLFFAQLASVQPDPALRDELVRRLLREQGIDPNRIVTAGFLQSAATLQDLIELSAAWTGVRSTAVFTVARSKTRRVDTLSGGVDDLSQTGRVTLQTVSVSLSHRLTPLASLNLYAAAQRGNGDTALQSNRQTTLELQYSTRLTPESSLNVSLRRAQYKTGLQPYDENALTASYGLRF